MEIRMVIQENNNGNSISNLLITLIKGRYENNNGNSISN